MSLTSKPDKGAWTVTLLAASFMTINFMDKAVLGIVAVSVMKDLNISQTEFGMIASSFFLLFSISAVLFGFIANRYSSRAVLLVLSAIWAMSQFPLAFTISIPLLYFSRIMLGFGEGPAYPMALHAAYKWFPNEKRNLPSAIIFQGITLGLLISGPFLTFLLLEFNYHAAFLALAIASVAWMVVWYFWGYDGTVDQTTTVGHATASDGLSYAQLLLDKTFLANMLVYWATYWVFATLFTWIPSYITVALNFSTRDTGWIFMLFTATSVPIVMGASTFSQYLLRRRVSSHVARGWLTAGSLVLGGILIIAATTLDMNASVKLGLLAIGFNLPQVVFVLSSAIVAEIAPPAKRSAMMSINSAIGTTGGLVAPALTGYLVQHAASPAEGYALGFIVGAAIISVAGLVGIVLINPKRSIERYARLSATNNNTSVSALAKGLSS